VVTGATLLQHAGIPDGDFNNLTVHIQFLNASDEAFEVTAGAFDNATVHFQFLNTEDAAVLQIRNDGKLPKSWFLMDNQSTVNVFCNSNLLTNVRESAESMKIHCNEGVVTTNLIVELAGYGTLWLHPDGIANILCLSRGVKEHG
jgi:hypothetical protein